MRGPTAFWQALERARYENLREAGESAPIPGGDGQTQHFEYDALGSAANFLARKAAWRRGSWRTTSQKSPGAGVFAK